jgi:hypothetical protein
MSNEAIDQTDIARLADRDSNATWPHPICRRAHARSNVHVETMLANVRIFAGKSRSGVQVKHFYGFLIEFMH